MSESALIEANATRPNRLRTELLLAGILVTFGLILLPVLIYVFGTMLLGPYGGGTHLGSFYGDLLRDLASGSAGTWVLILGPYGLVQIARLIFFRFKRTPSDEPDPTPEQDEQPSANLYRKRNGTPERREPTISL